MEYFIVFSLSFIISLFTNHEPIHKACLVLSSLTMCRCGTDIAKSTLEALSGMAIDLFRNRQQKNALTERLSTALKSMLKVS